MDAFTRIYDALGAERLCWFITQADNPSVKKREKKPALPFGLWRGPTRRSCGSFC